MTRPRVAIAHDYLTQRGGGERVVLALLRAFPQAQVHTLLYDAEATFPEFRDVDVVTSPLDRIALLRHHHRLALPLLAPAASRMTVDADMSLVSSSGWAHGFRFTGQTLVYCHNPARWLYQPDEYLGDASSWSLPALTLRALSPSLRRWDARAAHQHHRYLANSTIVRDRIGATYGLDASVLFPPSTLVTSGPQQEVGPFEPGFHLLVSRLLPYKNVDVAVAAFRRLPDERLLLVGQGPEEGRLRHDLPSNVGLVGGISDAQLRWAYANCAALVAPSMEDLGLTPLEAGEFGKPTLALRYGGYLDTVADGVNGLFFEEASAEAIADAVRRAGQVAWDGEAIRRHAEVFGEERFREAIRAEVEWALSPR